jgi:hypothetical protein
MLTLSLIIVSVVINIDGALSPNIWAKSIRPAFSIQRGNDRIKTGTLNIYNHEIACQPCTSFGHNSLTVNKHESRQPFMVGMIGISKRDQ